ncbi:MAG: tRNA (adenosine(37)-N6)-threonylcarbamoyltransferase complex dimerization subunit type 1 TsaB [Limisphaerales bacterium]
MKILALEFSTDQRSVAIAVGNRIVASVCESGGRATHAFALVEKALNEAGLEREAIDGIAVGLGPGSYTGIRAAIAIAQGWQLARDVKLAGIDSLSCLAHGRQLGGVRGAVGTIVDAQRNEFYLAGYELTDTDCRPSDELRIVSRAEIEQRLARSENLVGPDRTKLVPVSAPDFPPASSLAALALARNHWVDGTALEPVYLRPISFVKAPPPRFHP